MTYLHNVLFSSRSFSFSPAAPFFRFHFLSSFFSPSSPFLSHSQIPYREIRRVSQPSGAFSCLERALSSMKWEVDAQVCVRVCACVLARVPACETCKTLIRQLFCIDAPALLRFAESFRYTAARPSTGVDIHCRSSGSGATISFHRSQVLSPQAGGASALSSRLILKYFTEKLKEFPSSLVSSQV